MSQFHWVGQPQAEKCVQEIIEQALERCALLAEFTQRLQTLASGRLLDWLDHVGVTASQDVEKKLLGAGFVVDQVSSHFRIFIHPGAQLPRIVVKDFSREEIQIGLKVEKISDFLQMWGRQTHGQIEGSPFSALRRALVIDDPTVQFWAIERRGNRGIEPTYVPAQTIEEYLIAEEMWKSRCRDHVDLESVISLAQAIVQKVGQSMAAWIVLQCEREYWQGKNRAGQIQKNRQDRLGLGWANHDHHTFRSSREHFPSLVRLFEVLGFHCRERFYAGEEAGWGAQVMENSACGFVLFLDLDLAPGELEVDFAHTPLKNRKELGTIGLWCALHGDSILQAGMHHLEAQFLFEELKTDLEQAGVAMMDPFSNFSYLKQAFTHGEVWHVEPLRIESLFASGLITEAQKEQFLRYGAVGSHLENLQRREGYKGFNQKNVSQIIQRTDPRNL